MLKNSLTVRNAGEPQDQMCIVRKNSSWRVHVVLACCSQKGAASLIIIHSPHELAEQADGIYDYERHALTEDDHVLVSTSARAVHTPKSSRPVWRRKRGQAEDVIAGAHMFIGPSAIFARPFHALKRQLVLSNVRAIPFNGINGQR